MLHRFDTASATLEHACGAKDVAVSAGRAVFLRPESLDGDARCPAGSLNGDTDVTDDVVQLWDGDQIVNLGRAATAVALSDRTIAALVSEFSEGISLNGDDDVDDAVVEVAPATARSKTDWTNLGQAADVIDVNGSTVAWLTSEAAQGKSDLNGDRKISGQVLQVYNADAARMVMGVGAPLAATAADGFVVGARGLVAFRSPERRGNHGVVQVLEVLDAATGALCNTHQAVTPCFLEACDPRVPYRVLDNTVTFLTFEADQGEDLNDDGDTGDLVLQMFNVTMAEAAGACEPAGRRAAATTRAPRARTRRAEGRVQAGLATTLAAATAGVCTTTGAACASDANCAAEGGTCFVPPGGCVLDLGTPCNPTEQNNTCGPGFCQPTPNAPREGTCHELQKQCRDTDECVPRQCSDTDECTAPAVCNAGAPSLNRIVGPLAKRNGGATVFTGGGHCLEVGTVCTRTRDCERGEFCDEGTCRREHGLCRNDDECPVGSFCQPDLVTHALEDGDGDEIPDIFDNCPFLANPDQLDSDDNDVGDACQGGLATCVREAAIPSLRCRVQALQAAIGDLTSPDRFPKRLERTLARVDRLLNQAAVSDAHRRSRLRQSRHTFVQLVHVLGSARARRLIDADVRQRLLGAAAPMREDLDALVAASG